MKYMLHFQYIAEYFFYQYHLDLYMHGTFFFVELLVFFMT